MSSAESEAAASDSDSKMTDAPSEHSDDDASSEEETSVKKTTAAKAAVTESVSGSSPTTPSKSSISPTMSTGKSPSRFLGARSKGGSAAGTPARKGGNPAAVSAYGAMSKKKKVEAAAEEVEAAAEELVEDIEEGATAEEIEADVKAVVKKTAALKKTLPAASAKSAAHARMLAMSQTRTPKPPKATTAKGKGKTAATVKAFSPEHLKEICASLASDFKAYDDDGTEIEDSTAVFDALLTQLIEEQQGLHASVMAAAEEMHNNEFGGGNSSYFKDTSARLHAECRNLKLSITEAAMTKAHADPAKPKAGTGKKVNVRAVPSDYFHTPEEGTKDRDAFDRAVTNGFDGDSDVQQLYQRACEVKNMTKGADEYENVNPYFFCVGHVFATTYASILDRKDPIKALLGQVAASAYSSPGKCGVVYGTLAVQWATVHNDASYVYYFTALLNKSNDLLESCRFTTGTFAKTVKTAGSIRLAGKGRLASVPKGVYAEIASLAFNMYIKAATDQFAVQYAKLLLEDKKGGAKVKSLFTSIAPVVVIRNAKTNMPKGTLTIQTFAEIFVMHESWAIQSVLVQVFEHQLSHGSDGPILNFSDDQHAILAAPKVLTFVAALVSHI